MTSIAVWVGVDSRLPASLNIASDSRISWGNTEKWDQGRKIFATRSDAHLFGYCGEVLFPALVLPVVIDLIDRGLIKSGQDEIIQVLKDEMANYPSSIGFTVFHAFRTGDGMLAKFGLTTIEYKSGAWIVDSPTIPNSSDLVHVGGSGERSFRNAVAKWRKSNSGGTSRAIFSAFCESIGSNEDRRSGGPPQLGALYRTGPARLIGTIINDDLYFAGCRLNQPDITADIEWRNELFERYDSLTKKRLQDAQWHLPR